MAHFGNIKSYNQDKGTGTIAPEKGGDALPFKKKDLQHEAEAPKVDQRFSYETAEVDGGNKRATNLQMQAEESTQQKQASKQQG